MTQTQEIVQERQPKLSDEGKAALDSVLTKAAASRTVPAVHFAATTADGPIYVNQAGEKVFGEPEKGTVNEETTLQLYSQTKLVTSVAVLQLVERGVLSYDDPAIVEKYAPELWRQQILVSFSNGEAAFEPRQAPITLRRLLTHTSGLSYGFMNPTLLAYNEAHGIGKSYGGTVEDFAQPLLFQPGEKFGYSIGIDWAGIIVERASGQNLQDFFRENIWEPLGITEMTFFNEPDVVDRWQQVCTRTKEGELVHTTPRRPLSGPPGQLGGGGGLWGTNRSYLRFLQGLLQSQKPGGIIKPESFALLFEDALPPRGTSGAHAALARMVGAGTTTVVDPALCANEGQGLAHSVGMCVNTLDSPTGRKAGSGTWGGIATTEFWIDPKTGVAACGGTQFLRNRENGREKDPFAHVWHELETTLYKHLE